MARDTQPMEYNHETGAYEKRGKRGFVSEIALGMSGIWWGVTHPFQSGLRSFGAFSAILGLIALVAGAAHLVAGRPGSARLTTNPVDLGAWGADNLIRPVLSTGATAVQEGVKPIAASASDSDDEPVIVDLRRESAEQ